MGKKFRIFCETLEERDAVLKKLEKEGYTWCSCGRNVPATKFEHLFGVPMYIVCTEEKRLQQGTAVWLKLNDGSHVMRAHEYLKNECIVIYRKENQVIALDKRTGTKAVARCNPADKFDFDTGAKLAFERLIGPLEEPKKYNAKICITKPLSSMTVGKIYEVKDGHFKNDLGHVFPICGGISDADELQKFFGGNAFVEVVE